MTPEPKKEPEKKRYLRAPKVVFVRKKDDDHFLVSDLNDENQYEITKEMMKRDYEEI